MKKSFLFLSLFYLIFPLSLIAQLTSNSADKAVLKALKQFQQDNVIFTTIPILQTFIKSENLTDSLKLLANAYLDLNNYFQNENNINIEQLEERVKLLKGNGENTEYALIGIEIAYRNNQNFLKAIEYGQRVLELRKQRLGVKNPDYALSLSTLAQYYSSLGDYNKAIEYNQKALAIREKVLGKIHPDYATSLNNLADCYSKLGYYNKAIEYCQNALQIREQIFGNAHPDYASSLNNLATYYHSLGDYNKAIEYSQKALAITENVLGKSHQYNAGLLNNLAAIYSSLGDYNKAIEYVQKALIIQEKVFGKIHPDYATALINLADCYSKLGDYDKAIEYGQEALQIQKQLFGKAHPDYANTLNILANCYSDLGDFNKAIEYGQVVLAIREKVLGKAHPDYAASLNNLASNYSDLGDYNKAIEYSREALAIIEMVFGKTHPFYAVLLNNLDTYYHSLGDYNKAIEYGQVVLAIREKVLGKAHPDYATSLNNLASSFSALGDYNKAIEYGQQALKILENVFGKAHPAYVLSLENCSDFLFNAGNYLESKIYFSETFNLSNRLILTNFKYLTESERTKYWNNNNGFYNRASYFCFRSKSDELFSRINYDASLFSKGILLNSSIDLINIIKESNDTSLIVKFDYLQSIRIQLNKLYEKPINERKINTDSLEILSEKIEKELVKYSKDFGDFTKNLTIKWTDVQHQLRDNDVAIEFVAFPVGTDSTMYSALLLRKGWDYPKMIPLFEKKQIEKLISDISGSEGQRINMIYSGSVGKQLFDLVWKPLEDHIKSGDNVYFSATGVLHQIAIESLPTGNSSLVASDKYSLYRLSSTKQLVSEKLIVKDNKAVLYGGLKYDIEETVMLSQSQISGANDRLFASRRFSLDSTMRGAGWNYLPGTKAEVQEISGKLSNTTIVPSVYMDINGNEESFKALSGQKYSIIHIASHGFFLPIEEASKTDYFRFMTLDENNGIKGNNSMSRSGLILSGGNRAWKGDRIPSNIEDGILTAQEISTLDLRGTNLLVLSACETGLGEVSGEGVFGLQRGFKKAGVQTIIMTLWKVNDLATKDLMNKFYEQLLNGKSKREAFTVAQSIIREKYKSPYYWAGFIMLD